MTGKVSWTVIEGAEQGPYGSLFSSMTPGEPAFVLARIENTGDRPLKQLWAEGDQWSPITVEVKSGKKSGVWREKFFIGDLDPGESRVVYIKAFVPWFASDKVGRMTLNVREQWQ